MVEESRGRHVQVKHMPEAPSSPTPDAQPLLPLQLPGDRQLYVAIDREGKPRLIPVV